MKIRWWLLISVCALVLLAGSLLINRAAPDEWLDTDVLKLLDDPATPSADRLAIQHLQSQSSRYLIILAEGNIAAARSSIHQAVTRLQQVTGISYVMQDNPDAYQSVANTVFTSRYTWLLPAWMDRHFPQWQQNFPDSLNLSEKILAEMNAFLANPESVGLDQLVPQDPFLLFQPEYFSAVSTSRNAGQTSVWLQLGDLRLAGTTQTDVLRDVEEILQSLQESHPQLTIRYTGAPKIAAASESNIRSEVTWLNSFTALYLILIFALLIRKPRIIISLILLLGISQACAVLATIAIFGSVHVLTLVMGAILGGIAVDYGLHLLLHCQLSIKARNRAVITGAASTISGFLILILSELMVLKQLAVYISTGLTCALLLGLFICKKSQAHTPQILSTYPVFPWHGLPRLVTLLLILSLIPAALNITWDDKLSEMNYPSDVLYAEADAIQTALSEGENQYSYLVKGANPVEALENLWQITTTHSTSLPQISHPGQWLSSPHASQQLHSAMQQLNDFPQSLAAQMENHGYLPEAFTPFFEKWQSWVSDTNIRKTQNQSLQNIAASLPLHLQNAFISLPSQTYIMLRSSQLIQNESDLPNLIPASLSQWFEGFMASYRQNLSRLVLAGLLFLITIIVIVYRRAAPAILAIPFLAITGSFALCTLFSSSLNLFHLTGGFLGACIALDYALFSTEAWKARLPVPQSVVLSILTTAGVFAILCSSSIPAVRALGMSVCFAILIAAVLILTSWPLKRKESPHVNTDPE